MTVDIPSSKHVRLREDFMPSCVEEMQQWGWDRQQDFHAATMAGRPEEVGRISQLIIRGARVARSSSRTNYGRVSHVARWVSAFDD